MIKILILKALTLQKMGESAQALITLEESLTLGEPKGYTRVFLDEGEPVQMLLAQWCSHAGSGPLRNYALSLLAQFDEEPTADTSPNDALIEPLTPRELEVLHIMALGKTNRQIAEQLVVARGTVKAHTASIYRKLDVATRTEAVTRARELGILP